jgi:hypothetical protein
VPTLRRGPDTGLEIFAEHQTELLLQEGKESKQPGKGHEYAKTKKLRHPSSFASQRTQVAVHATGGSC